MAQDQYTRQDGANRILGICIVWHEDESPDLSWLDADSGRYTDVEDVEERERYEREDAARLQAFYDGGWHMKGCWAEAKVLVGGVTQTIRSGGLWGIESDAEDGYAREVEDDERHELLKILESLGFNVEGA